MAEAGLGIAILPRSVLKLARGAGMQAIAIRPVSLSREVALISRSDRGLSPAASRLAHLIRERLAAVGDAAN